jgi:NitT/TauT family transport system substrate-binding protein
MNKIASLLACVFVTSLVVLSPAKPEPALIPLKVGLLKIAGFANAYAAKVEKTFERNGLDVTLVKFRSSPEGMAASGRDRYCASHPRRRDDRQRAGLRIFGCLSERDRERSWTDSGSVQSLVDSDIKTLKDLAGKRVATVQISGQQTIAAQFAMRKAGLDPGKVQFIEIPYPRHPDVLKSRQVDAVITTEPYTTQLLTSGVGRVLAWHYAEAMPGGPLGVWWAKKSYIGCRRPLQPIDQGIDRLHAC